jgi:hypothetical protein
VTPLGVGKHYLICSASAPPNSQCSNQALGYFDLATAHPMDQPVQPGYVLLFGNPAKDQLRKQPTGTKATFIGLFDFTGANLSLPIRSVQVTERRNLRSCTTPLTVVSFRVSATQNHRGDCASSLSADLDDSV